MPVVARIEVWPDGDAKKRQEIGVMVLHNKGHIEGDASEDPDVAHYHYKVMTDPTLPYEPERFDREGELKFYSRKQNLWQIVRRVLNDILPDEKRVPESCSVPSEK